MENTNKAAVKSKTGTGIQTLALLGSQMWKKRLQFWFRSKPTGSMYSVSGLGMNIACL